MDGKKIDRSQLFDDNNSQVGSDMDNQDFAVFEKMMESRIQLENADSSNDELVAVDDMSVYENQEENTSSNETGGTPMFKLFAGSNLIKVETEAIEPEYAIPQRPEVQLEESDSEEHWCALAAAAIDATSIYSMSKVPLPAMQYPKRVVHIKLDDPKPAEANNTKKSKSNSKSRLKLKSRKIQKHKLNSKQREKRCYARVLSPYMGGIIRARMLNDVIREESARAEAIARKTTTNQRGGGSGPRSKDSGFRGRGRGRRGIGGVDRPTLSIGSKFKANLQ
ncbi:hypothetical protein GGI25_000283 [Coemansia spiralis]|uniref:Uncharacterized protein n=2 Tax=Coemansia TaxID=4863 RepID=A0A9W8L1B1_9FUNG|nr:hypothetical protein BX070DRAFT_236114 [Coemansia spiralis]KAJ1995841.1 hypothetical protein EDC05_000499 [Coemansia umbellata]KAJ2625855.1 hypothetical protein GGI26_000318 [Coemansia sp. RSA 1358]KAJ2680977.1 hypothetical protein GGI25_000283 [Coemansia spiralis]